MKICLHFALSMRLIIVKFATEFQNIKLRCELTQMQQNTYSGIND